MKPRKPLRRMWLDLELSKAIRIKAITENKKIYELRPEDFGFKQDRKKQFRFKL